jgi:3,4-dihydroxy 2-butanone 4-phosphate synthase/GTP cyclohydrolase II
MNNKKQQLIPTPTIKLHSKYVNLYATAYQTFYENQPDMKFVLAIHTKNISSPTPLRIHSSCIYSEIFKSQLCDCAEQLEKSIQIISEQNGLLLYLDQEGRGHGLFNKTRELKLQEEGYDTVEASEHLNLRPDSRDYDVVKDILNTMRIDTVKIITNHSRKTNSLKKYGIKVVDRIPIEIEPNKYNHKYLKAKKDKLGHLLNHKSLN